ncbi:hypothetical protein ABPG77_002609 [Micractinium sp. CCAP 211/92]
MDDEEEMAALDIAGWEAEPSRRACAAQNMAQHRTNAAETAAFRARCAELQEENAQLRRLLMEERAWAGALAASRGKERDSAQRRAAAAQAAADQAAGQRDAAEQRAASAELGRAAAEERAAAAEAVVTALQRQLEAARAQLALAQQLQGSSLGMAAVPCCKSVVAGPPATPLGAKQQLPASPSALPQPRTASPSTHPALARTPG